MGTAKEKFTEKQQKKAVKHSGPRRKPTTEEGRGAGRRLSPNSLMVQMIGAFVILIIMIFLVGTVSYSVAKNVVSE